MQAGALGLSTGLFYAPGSFAETDEVVESVAMPAELYRWVEQYVLENYLPEKRKKRKRDNWKEVDSDQSARR